MLAGTGLGNDPFLAHPQGEKSLTKGVVDLVGAGVIEVFPLQPDARTAIGTPVVGRQALGFIQGRGPTHIVLEKTIEFTGERRILPGLSRRSLQLRQGGHQRFGDVLTAEAPETAMGSRPGLRLQAGRIRKAGVWQGAGHGATDERRLSVSRRSRDAADRRH